MTCKAVEYKRVDGLAPGGPDSDGVAPGTKVRLTGVPVRAGVLLLDNRCIQVSGVGRKVGIGVWCFRV